MATPEPIPCPLCERPFPPSQLTRHHLQTRKHDKHDIEKICRDCHGAIHAFFTNQEVAKGLNTLDALRQHPEFARHLAFIKKQAPGSRVRTKQARRRR